MKFAARSMDFLIVNGIREVAHDIESQICELMGPATIRHATSIATAYAALSQRESARDTLVFACVESFFAR